MTFLDLAMRFIGAREITGERDNPLIVWWLQLSDPSAAHDETPWCSAFVNGIAWMCRLPRSKSNAARSWLRVGLAVPLESAEPGDVVVLTRGVGVEPGPDVLNAPGHVGFLVGCEGGHVMVLGGNQANAVTVARFDESRVLGVRRLDFVRAPSQARSA